MKKIDWSVISRFAFILLCYMFLLLMSYYGDKYQLLLFISMMFIVGAKVFFEIRMKELLFNNTEHVVLILLSFIFLHFVLEWIVGLNSATSPRALIYLIRGIYVQIVFWTSELFLFRHRRKRSL